MINRYTILEKDGKKYLILGEIAIPFNEVDANGKPIIQVRSEETINENGGKDVKVFVPVLKVEGKQQEIQ